METINRAVWKDFKTLKNVYPGLEMCVIEVKPRIAKGIVTLPELSNEPREVRALLSLTITVIYTDDFPNKEIRVFDSEQRINWDIVPDEHRHSNGIYGLCTHHSDELKLVRHPESKSILIVRSAILLYLAYLEFVKKGEWPVGFKELPHGEAGALPILNKLKRRR